MPKLTRVRKALDTEVTGVDVYHGATPFLVTVCNEQWENTWWEWDVDPLTRKVNVIQEDIDQILAEVEQCDQLDFQNGKFDMSAMKPILPKGYVWPFHKIGDTLIRAHLLASNHPKDLTSQAIEYLGINIEHWESAVEKAVQYVRSIVKQKGSPIKDWRIAKAGLPEMPSAKEKVWKFDMWLPRAFAKWCLENDRWDLMPQEEGARADHSFWTVLSDYANPDSSTTLALAIKQDQILAQRGLTKIYNERIKLVRITHEMEQRGVTARIDHLNELTDEYRLKSAQCDQTCVNIAKHYGYELTLPKSGNNKSLTEFVFNVMKLPPVEYSDSGNPSLDKNAIEKYLEILPERDLKRKFIENLRAKRKRDTALQYMASYERFWLPLGIFNKKGEQLWFCLHPSLNITGTDTLRWSSSNPNEQNISKQGMFEGDKKSLRYIFGPAPGREWWSLDAKNIELRIPAYESGQQELINLFEKPDEPPYYGSTHLLNFHTIYSDLWDKEFEFLRKKFIQEFGVEKANEGFQHALAKVGPHCKKKFADTWYQWCKNGGFAVQYGAVDTTAYKMDPITKEYILDSNGNKIPVQVGTADRAFHKAGAHAKLLERFDKLTDLNQKYIQYANRHGYVETIPDTSVDANRGYPLLCTRSDYGKILETVPLNYHVQSTAMWWTARGMVRCDELLKRWHKSEGFDGFMTMQVHDELVFDLPVGSGKEPWKTNLPKVQQLADAMAKGGEGIGIPTPVGIEYHAVTWAEGVTLK